LLQIVMSYGRYMPRMSRGYFDVEEKGLLDLPNMSNSESNLDISCIKKAPLYGALFYTI